VRSTCSSGNQRSTQLKAQLENAKWNLDKTVSARSPSSTTSILLIAAFGGQT